MKKGKNKKVNYSLSTTEALEFSVADFPQGIPRDSVKRGRWDKVLLAVAGLSNTDCVQMQKSALGSWPFEKFRASIRGTAKNKFKLDLGVVEDKGTVYLYKR